MSPNVPASGGLALLASIAALLALWSDPALPRLAAAQEGSELVTLWARDDLRSSFDFRAGTWGGRIVDGEVALDRAQIVFGALHTDALSYGFVQDELVRVIDLGPLFVQPHTRAQDDAPKFPLSAFHTLFLDGARFAYQEAGGRAVRLSPANALLAPMVEDGLRWIEPRVGHTYLIRFQGLARGASDQVVKLQVVEHRPADALTFRWAHVATL